MAKLYLIPTPIGNLEDITYRAVRILGEVDLVLAEDTRKSRVLLDKYGIQKPLKSFHQANEHKVLSYVVDELKTGKIMALVTDAGTPGISDPGFLLARECIKEGIHIETLPGATAFIPALVNSGLPCDRFVFEGFLPHKKGRKTKLELLADEERTVILYESPHRLLKTLRQMTEHFGGDRNASVSRELTKKFEETIRGTLDELAQHFTENPIKGEFVIVVDGSKS